MVEADRCNKWSLFLPSENSFNNIFKKISSRIESLLVLPTSADSLMIIYLFVKNILYINWYAHLLGISE